MPSSKACIPHTGLVLVNFASYAQNGVTISTSGSHSIFVCCYHRNSKLMCSALPIRHYYASLSAFAVLRVEIECFT